MATPPSISWSDLAGQSVGLWGLGVEGRANLRRLQALGITPVLVDDAPRSPTEGGLPVLATADGGIDALARCDVVVKSPGISRHRADVTRLTDEGVAVAGGLGLWMEEADRDRVVCITGTKGKSTTAAVTGHLLEGLGHRCLVGGNIGRLPYDPEVGTGFDFWVIEISSFQATDLASSPPVVAVTSLHPDHLDWHGNAETYFADKLSACTRRGARTTVADGESSELRAHRSLLGPDVRWVSAGDPVLEGAPVDGHRNWAGALGLPGAHQHRDALIARACLIEMGVPGAEDDHRLAAAAEGFTALDSRLRPIGTVDGVTFVDDSLSTNVLPTLAALDTFADRRVALIVGGFDRGIDYGPLAAGLAARAGDCLVVTVPANGPRIHRAIESAPGPTPPVVDCPDLASATARAFGWARPGGVVLLSPAAPSFGEFRDYRERAAAFADAMASCAAEGSAAG
jgi:UDP-N-acetylmuramoylalanine--D-glutamate ligase